MSSSSSPASSGQALAAAEGIVTVYKGLSQGISDAFGRCTDLKDALDVALAHNQAAAAAGGGAQEAGVLSNLRARFSSIFPALSHLQEELQAATGTLAPFLHLAQTLEKDFQEVELQRAACRADRAQLEGKEQDLARRLSASGKIVDASIQEKQREIEALMARVKLAESADKDGRDRTGSLLDENKRLAEEVQRLTEENNAMKEDARKFIKQSDKIEKQAKQDIADLRKALRSLEEECEHYKDLLGNEQQRAKDIHQDYRKKLQRATSASYDSQQPLPQSFATMRTLSASASGRARPIRELSEVVRQNEIMAAECSSLRGEVARLSQENMGLVAALKAAQDDARFARAHTGTLQQSRSELQKRLERQTLETRRAERTMTSLISSTTKAWKDQRDAEEDERWESIQPIDSRPTERLAQPLRHPHKHRSIHVENW